MVTLELSDFYVFSRDNFLTMKATIIAAFSLWAATLCAQTEKGNALVRLDSRFHYSGEAQNDGDRTGYCENRIGLHGGYFVADRLALGLSLNVRSWGMRMVAGPQTEARAVGNYTDYTVTAGPWARYYFSSFFVEAGVGLGRGFSGSRFRFDEGNGGVRRSQTTYHSTFIAEPTVGVGWTWFAEGGAALELPLFYAYSHKFNEIEFPYLGYGPNIGRPAHVIAFRPVWRMFIAQKDFGDARARVEKGQMAVSGNVELALSGPDRLLTAGFSPSFGYFVRNRFYVGGATHLDFVGFYHENQVAQALWAAPLAELRYYLPVGMAAFFGYFKIGVGAYHQEFRYTSAIPQGLPREWVTRKETKIYVPGGLGVGAALFFTPNLAFEVRAGLPAGYPYPTYGGLQDFRNDSYGRWLEISSTLGYYFGK